MTVAAVQQEIVAIAGVTIAVGEGVLTAFPAGPVHTAIAAAIPVAIAIGTRARTVPVGRYLAIAGQLEQLLRRAESPTATQ